MKSTFKKFVNLFDNLNINNWHFRQHDDNTTKQKKKKTTFDMTTKMPMTIIKNIKKERGKRTKNERKKENKV